MKVYCSHFFFKLSMLCWVDLRTKRKESEIQVSIGLYSYLARTSDHMNSVQFNFDNWTHSMNVWYKLQCIDKNLSVVGSLSHILIASLSRCLILLLKKLVIANLNKYLFLRCNCLQLIHIKNTLKETHLQQFVEDFARNSRSCLIWYYIDS